MALSFAHGAIQWLTTDALNADLVVSGLGFQPEAIRLYWMGIQSTTDAASEAVTMQRGVGFTNGTTHRAVCTTSIDAAGSMDTAAIVISNGVVVTIDGAGAVTGKLSVASIDSGGFTLNVDDVTPQNLTVFYEAWGGDPTNVTIGDIAEPAGTGTQNYTATGFTSTDDDSQVVMLAGCQSVQAVGTGEAKDSGFYAGFATGTAAAEQVVVVGNNDEGSANADTDGYCQSGQCSAQIVIAGGTSVDAAATLSAFGTDLFTLNWTARAVTDRRSIYMAIKGGSWKAGELTIDARTGGNTATVGSLSFAPVGISLIGRHSGESTANTAGTQDRIGFGSGSSTSSRRAMGVWDETGTGNAEIDLVVEYDEVLAHPSNAGALLSAIDINAMNSDGFQLIVDTGDATANPSTWIGYLAFGNAAAAGTTVSPGAVTHTYTGQVPQVKARVQPAAVTHTYTAQAPNVVGTLKPGAVTHSYTGQAPQVKSRVQPGAASHAYTGQEPRFIHSLKPGVVEHSYTGLSPQAKASVQPGAASHSYTAEVPQVKARVQPEAATHTYTGRVPSIAAGSSLRPSAVTHAYTGQAAQIKARVQPGAATHTYTANAPNFIHSLKPGAATHSYTAQAPQVRASVQPAALSHAYTAQVPQARARVQPGAATHTYLGREPTVSASSALQPPTVTHSYLGLTPAVLTAVSIPAPAAVHTYTAQVPQAKPQVAPGSVTHAYAPQTPQARSSVGVGVVTHAYTANAPQARTSVQPGVAEHVYTGQVPGLNQVGTVAAPVSEHAYQARVPQAQVKVSVPAVVHIYTAHVPAHVGKLTLRVRSASDRWSAITLSERTGTVTLSDLTSAVTLSERTRNANISDKSSSAEVDDE